MSLAQFHPPNTNLFHLLSLSCSLNMQNPTSISFPIKAECNTLHLAIQKTYVLDIYYFLGTLLSTLEKAVNKI